jgi:hypothetical protein
MLRINRLTLAAAAVGACVAWPSAAPAISPDAIDAGDKDKPQLTQRDDLRSPDATYPMETTIDKRSPDVRFGQPNGEPAPTVGPVRVRIVEVPSSGFEWGDAGIGAAGMLALVLLGVGAAMANSHRRERRFPTAMR